MTGNVVNFTEMKEKFKQEEQADLNDPTVVDEISFELTAQVVEVLLDAGYDPKSFPDTIKEIRGIYENIKGLMYRSVNNTYPIHIINDKVFETPNAAADLDEFFEAMGE